MQLDLTDTELITAATACRAMAYQEGERAKKMESGRVALVGADGIEPPTFPL
jgi:hypothetical protein